MTKKPNQDISDAKQVDSSDQDIQPPYTSDSKANRFELEDDEGNKYLNYKSISGMDLVPRIREPTPEKKRAHHLADNKFNDNDWEGKCKFY